MKKSVIGSTSNMGLARFYPRLTQGSMALLMLGFSVYCGCSPRKVVSTHTAPPEKYQESLYGLDLSGAEKIPHDTFEGAGSIYLLKNGDLFFRSRMEIDADGSPNAKNLDPKYGQLTTSLQYPGIEGQKKFINSEEVPYIVLPMGFFDQFDIKLGDLAVVFYRDISAFAIFADVGPANKIGEGSIRLAELLGHSPWHDWQGGQTFSTHGGISAREIEFVVFTGSRPLKLVPDTINETIQKEGEWLLKSQKIGQ